MDEIREAIAALLETVPAVGQVHRFERYAKNRTDMRVFYQQGEQVLGWHIRRVRTTEHSDYPGRWSRVYRWELRGYLSLDDESQTELQFDNVIEQICAVFRADDTLGGSVDTCIVGNEAGIQVLESYPVMFAGVLCHSARLALNTRIYL
ncbi:MAG: hypothetical protein KZQ99_04450 [Candidatus Thiodiazotropha sp. (ex Dulcina madagascariensis)]|nr:hypothetical protein [Candidatus Thiodiazotropha sp. (ex Dulcina madagascariensis)]